MRISICLLALLVLSSSGGCAALAIGGAAVGGIFYVKGDVERTYPYPIDVVWNATLAAMTELQLSPGYQAKDQLRGKMKWYTATGDRIKIEMSSHHPTSTELELRVNIFGNDELSMALIRKIEEHLPPSRPSTTTGFPMSPSPWEPTGSPPPQLQVDPSSGGAGSPTGERPTDSKTF